jgi:hypothetical protein
MFPLMAGSANRTFLSYPVRRLGGMVSYVGPSERERRLDAVEARGAELAGVLARAAAELVEVVAEAVTDGLWKGEGFRSAEHWVGLRFGLSPRRARHIVAAARALPDLPACAAAFASGEISEDHVAEMVRAGVTAANDAAAADLARAGSVTQLRKALSFLPRPDRPDPDPGDDLDERDRAPAPAHTSFGFADDGTWGMQVRGLDPIRGGLADRAMRAAREALFRDRHGVDPDDLAQLDDITWSDAFARLCEAALSQLDPHTATGRPTSERYLVNLHLDADHPDHAQIHLGPALPAALRQQQLCDTQVRLWCTDQLGNVGLGRRQHVVDPRLRTVIEHRDGGCIVPGCPVQTNLEIHHLGHWEHGWPTETWNLAALCRGTDGHHRQIHDGRLVIRGNPDQPDTLEFTNTHGQPLTRRRPPPPTTDPPPGRWTNRSGERADWNHLTWRDPDTPDHAA